MHVHWYLHRYWHRHCHKVSLVCHARQLGHWVWHRERLLRSVAFAPSPRRPKETCIISSAAIKEWGISRHRLPTGRGQHLKLVARALCISPRPRILCRSQCFDSIVRLVKCCRAQALDVHSVELKLDAFTTHEVDTWVVGLGLVGAAFLRDGVWRVGDAGTAKSGACGGLGCSARAVVLSRARVHWSCAEIVQLVRLRDVL